MSAEIKVISAEPKNNSVRQLIKVSQGNFVVVKSNFGNEAAKEAITQGVTNTIVKK